MRIAFLIPSLTIGGAEKAVSLLSTELSYEHDTYIMLLQKKVQFPFKGHVYVISQEDSFQGRLHSYVSYFKLLKLINPDVVISLLTKAHTMNALVPAKVKKRLIWVQNFPTYHHFRNKIVSLQNLLKWLTIYKRVDRILAASSLLAHKLTMLYRLDGKKVSVLYNPVNINEIETLKRYPVSNAEWGYFGSPTYVNVGRLTWQKGQWHLIRSFKEVSKELKDAKLIIIGGGKMKIFLHSLIKKLDLNNKVNLFGPTSNPYRLMGRSDVFVFPSVKEGLPISLIEALACGLTVISSDCPSGPREILTSDTPHDDRPLKEPEFAQYGILMPTPDGVLRDHTQALTWCEKMWAEWMTIVGSDKNIRRHYSSIASNRALEFDVKKICKILLDIISM
jgi:glycosyltransferase involved in cell wall biosynthesis